jgi:hypothetical protein
MGSIDSVTERHAYRLRNRNRRQVVAELTPDDSSGGASANSYSLSPSDVGLNSIESVAFETPVINTGSTTLTWDADNNEIDAYDTGGTVAANTTDLSGETIVAVITGKDE